MSLRKLRAARVNTVSANQYAGEFGSIFWNETTGELRLSDGVTLGGLPIALSYSTVNTVGAVKPGNGLVVEPDGKLNINNGPAFYFDAENKLRLFPATPDQIGGIKLGPGVTTNDQGQLVVDASGLPLNIGDLQIDGASISTVNNDEDINLITQGTGALNFYGGGGFIVHRDGLLSEHAFTVTPEGYVTVSVPTLGSGATGMLINGNGGEPVPTTVSGVTLRTVGNDGMINTMAIDSHGTGVFPTLTFRASRGTGEVPTATKTNDVIGRVGAAGWGATTFVTDPSNGRAPTSINFVATEDYTDAHGGSKIEFYTSPTAGTTRTLSATILPAGITAVTFTGNLIGNITGTAPAGLLTGTALSNNVVSSSLTSVGVLANLTVTNTINGSVNGNAGTVTNGVYTNGNYSDPTWLTISKTKVGLGNVENTALSTWTGSANIATVGVLTSGSIGAGFTAIPNARLANSTISGISLGSNLASLTIGTHLTGTSYNGSTGVTIATDATTDATAGVLVARDSNGLITAQNYKGNSRDAGTLTAGSTLTINYATDHIVLVNITGAITIAHTNITAGRNVKVIVVNATGTNLAVNTGIADINTTGNNANANLNSNRMGAYEFISFGTTTATLYCNSNK